MAICGVLVGSLGGRVMGDGGWGMMGYLVARLARPDIHGSSFHKPNP